MPRTDSDGYQSAWRADRARDIPAGDPWAAPASRSTAPDDASPDAASPDAVLPDTPSPDPASAGAASAGAASASGAWARAAAVRPDPSTSEHPTAPWPFVTGRTAFPAAESSRADEFPNAAAVPSPPWPGDSGEPLPPAVWPPTDLPHESPPGLRTPLPPPSSSGPPPAWSQQSAPPPPAWPQQPAPPSWPPLADTSADNAAVSVVEQRASPVVQPSASESASAVSGPSGWAYATDMAAPGVYVPGTPPPWPEQHTQSVAPSVPPTRPLSPASGTTGYAHGGGASDDLGTWRSRRRGVITLVVLIAVVVFSVVGVAIGTRSHGHAKAQTPSAAGPSTGGSSAAALPGPVPSGAPTAGSTVGSVPLGDGVALIRKIVPAPTGSHVYDVGDSTAGVMDLEQYAHHYFNGDATELNRLRKEGFQVAASTDYVRSDGIEVATHLVQFTNLTGAEDYFEVEKSAWTADDRVTAGFEVPATPDAIGYELSKVDSLGNRRSVMYEHVGNVVVVVNIYTSRNIDQAVDIKVLQAQLAALS